MFEYLIVNESTFLYLSLIAESCNLSLVFFNFSNEFNKRSGLLPTMSLGGKPRSLELEEDIGETSSRSRDAKSALKSINAVDSSTVNSNITKA